MISIEAGELNRIMKCHGSAHMERYSRPATDPTDEQREGIAAHYMAAAILKGEFTDPVEFVERKLPNGVYGTPELAEIVGEYVDAIIGRPYVETARFFVEETYSFVVPSSATMIGARPDLCIYDPGSFTLYVDDFKTGWRIVDIEENWTMMFYAYVTAITHQLPVSNVVLTIHQPRPHHPDGRRRFVTLTIDELQAQIVKLFAVLGPLESLTELRTGNHCGGCPSLHLCYPATQAAMNSIDVASRPYNDNLTAEELSSMLDTMQRATKAIADKLAAFEENASHRLKRGELLPGWSLEPRFGNRTFHEGTTAETLSLLTNQPIADLTVKPKLISPAALQRLGVDETLVNALSYRPPLDAKLTKFNATKAAKKLFG